MLDCRHFIINAFQAEGAVKDADVQRATEHAVSVGGDVLDSLVTLGIVTARRLAITKAKICEFPFVDLNHFDVDTRNTRLMPRSMAERLTAFPLFVVDDTATVAMLDPLNLHAVDQVRQVLKADVDPVLVDADLLRSLIANVYSHAPSEATDRAAATAGAEEPAVSEEHVAVIVHQIIACAAGMGASDIHISPDEVELLLRYRVDGLLHPQQAPALSAHKGMVQHLKALAGLDLTESRRARGGTFRFMHRESEPVDVRLSLVPTIHGESVVMRLLPAAATLGPVSALGMPERISQRLVEVIERPHGMILVTGPAGSGKTTTLYTALNHLSSPTRNIITVEEPVEVRFSNIRQVQADSQAGMPLAGALMSVLHQDPDVLLVGEIRDEETAKVAAMAAMSGRMVLATLCGEDAIGAVASLRDLGVPAMAVRNALMCVIAQRLVGKLCDACAIPENNAGAIASLPAHWQGRGFKRATGCRTCGNTGYRGRVGVFEALNVTPTDSKTD